MTTQRRKGGKTLPRLCSTLAGCVRWRRSDLDDLLRKQLDLIGQDFAATRMHQAAGTTP